MSYDGAVMRSLIYELNNRYRGGRIDKIYQPEEDLIYLHLRKGGNREVLMLSAASNQSAAYLTTIKRTNPQTPPTFCMVLRKHLENAEIIEFSQEKMDRILYIKCLSLNELGDQIVKTLVIEVMGKHSNIILFEDETMRIIDSIKRVNLSMSSVRQVLPGLKYTTEDIVTKANPLDVSRDTFDNLFDETPSAKSIRNFFVHNFTGVSPLLAREICTRGDVDESRPIGSFIEEREQLYSAFQEIVSTLINNQYTPNIVHNEEGESQAFSCIELKQYPREHIKHYDSMHVLLDEYYMEREVRQRKSQKSHSLQRQIETHLHRAQKKLQKQREELDQANHRQKYKVYADVISANAYRIKRGDKTATLENFYDDMKPIEVPLDERKDAIQNAAAYYKKYSRLKNASQVLQGQIAKSEHEVEYLESVYYSLEEAVTEQEIEEIRDEFNEDFLKRRRSSKKKNKSKPSKPLVYKLDNGAVFYIGKNNRQNEEVTFKIANSNDYWFHIKDLPGSHVILKSPQDPTEDELLIGAQLAAYFSKARQSSNVEIDYTQRKNVKRHPAKQVGLVNYENYNTLVVTPSKDVIDDKKLSNK